MRWFLAGLVVGSLAYPLGLVVGEELGRRNNRSNGYAFGA